jgi:elongation factor 1-beta
MGQVVVVYKIMPAEDADFEALKAAVSKACRVDALETEEIGFGIKAIKLTTTVEDDAGGSEAIEQKLAKIHGVGSVQVLDAARLF